MDFVQVEKLEKPSSSQVDIDEKIEKGLKHVFGICNL